MSVPGQLYHPWIHDHRAPVPSYWEATAPPLRTPAETLEGDHHCEVAIVGGGYTGLSAALHLARDHRVACAVLEAGPIGWGASGRNGGFCVLGSSKRSLGDLARRYGAVAARRFFELQRTAIALVRDLARDEAIELDAAGRGELLVAHRPARLAALRRQADETEAITGERWALLSRAELREGLVRMEEAAGALLIPHGFGLHPLRYVRGLAEAAARHGAALHSGTDVLGLGREGGGYRLRTAHGSLRARRVLVATNGFYREGLTRRLDGCLLPALSSIVVTRPLSAVERAAQGWREPLLVADTRTLLFYIRLLPDGRLLFGARGGTDAAPAAFARRISWMRGRLAARFPAWAAVEIDHAWWGLVCLAYDLVPHLGPLDEGRSLWFAGAYHGGGVAMATALGRAAAARLAGAPDAFPLPDFIDRAPPRFPLPSLRLLGLRLGYLAARIGDAWP
jgi:glycine/D-amino acid oxidase-like deaminating enzyme